MKPITEEKSEHLMYFIAHGFHQMEEKLQSARDELKKRGVNTKLITHQCICKQCKKD